LAIFFMTLLLFVRDVVIYISKLNA
jgi:hypothetical protein